MNAEQQCNLLTVDSAPYAIHLMACAVLSNILIDYMYYHCYDGVNVITLDLQWVAMLFLQMIIIVN